MKINIKKIEKEVEKLKSAKQDFIVIKSPSKTEIKYKGIEIIEEHDRVHIDGSYLCNMVASHIDKLEHITPINRRNDILKYKLLDGYNAKGEGIKNFNTVEFLRIKTISNLLMIDINHCYWRTAYLLNYIDRNTYNKGLDEDQYIERSLKLFNSENLVCGVEKKHQKDYLEQRLIDDSKNKDVIEKTLKTAKGKAKTARLMAIGFLANNKNMYVYKKGEIVAVEDVGNTKYRQARTNIINHVENLYLRLLYDFNGYSNNYAFKTDAFFVQKNYEDTLNCYLYSCGYESKKESGFGYVSQNKSFIQTEKKTYTNSLKNVLQN